MAQLVSTRSLLVSTRPLVVGVANDEFSLRSLCSRPPEERLATCDVVEVRLDTIGMAAADLRPLLSSLGLPVLLTARHPAEGGQAPADATARMGMIQPLLDLATLVDIELRSIMEARPLIDEARSRGITVMGSFHDFTATPPDEVLQGAIDFGQQAGLEAVKLATYLNSHEDLVRLLNLVTRHQRLRLSVMGMGQFGPVSRLVLARFGSLFNYGFLGEPNAPGQWPAARLKQVLAEL